MHGKKQMPEALAEELEDRRIRQVRQWREEQLIGAGIGIVAAVRLSDAFDVPYRRAIELHERGMSDDQLLNELLD